MYYKEIMNNLNLSPSDIQTIDDLKKMPILTREGLKNNFSKLWSNNNGKGRIIVHTSGSSGSGLPIAYNKNDLAINFAFIFRQFIWFNVKPKEWRITLFGSKVVPENQNSPPYWRYNFFEKQILLSIFHLSEKTKNDFIIFFKKHQGLFLEGFASVLSIVADFLLQTGVIIPMKIVYSTGEPIDDVNRQKVEKAFNCRLIDCYGMTEWAGLIQECECGAKHMMGDYGILEILDENNYSVNPGEEGYLVWTGLQRYEMPLIRYRIGDKGMWSINNDCECGKPYPLVETTITRDSDIIKTPNGSLFSPRVINQFLKNKVAFNYCQFIQETTHDLQIRIVPGTGDYEKEAQILLNDLSTLFHSSIKIKVSFEDKPLMRGLGKYPLIINRVSS